jgi:crossover junction endodeoxyribonuclease RuvC
MRILGIDPGSRATGYGVIERDGSTERAVTYGVVRLSGDKDHPERLKQIYADLSTLIERHAPEVLAIEMPVYGQNPQSMLKLGRAQAAAMLAGLNAGLSVAQYTPKEVKKSVTGNGNASKKQVQYMVESILDLGDEDQALTHDASDALAIALCHGGRQAHGDTQSYTGWESFVASNPDRVEDG